MRQYWGVKRRCPEALLLFRLGDFYELFFADAVTAARELEITLTARNKEKGVPIPMCGVPYHSAQNYIARLIQKGYKVAICDQMEDAKQAKKLVKREITRVLTPGTAAAQSGEEVRYLAAIAPGPAAVGLALLEVSTGEFRVTECSGPNAAAELRQELERWRPREILHPSQSPPLAGPLPPGAALTPLEDWIFAPDFARRELETHFGVIALDGLGLAAHGWAASAAAAIVHYVKETQRSRLEHVDRLSFYHARQGLVLDAPTIRNLELVEPIFAGEDPATLRHGLDQTLTPMGRRLLRGWILAPLSDRAALEARLDAVAALAGPLSAPAAPGAANPAPAARPVEEKELWRAYRAAYGTEPFVRIVHESDGAFREPEPKLLRGTNFCDVGFAVDRHAGRLVALGALDNLMKGAAGAAVQCFNVRAGLPETTALDFLGLHPV